MAYQLSDLISELQTKAKDSALSSSLLTQFLNDAQDRIVGNQTFAFMEKTDTGTLSIGQATMSYPSDNQLTIDIMLVDPTTATSSNLLDYLEPETFWQTYPTPSAYSNARPSAWTDYGRLIYFDRPSDKAYNYTHRYVKRPTVLAGSTDVPDVPAPWREALINYAMASIELYRDNHMFASTYTNRADQIAEDMAVRLATRQFNSAPNVFTNGGGGAITF